MTVGIRSWAAALQPIARDIDTLAKKATNMDRRVFPGELKFVLSPLTGTAPAHAERARQALSQTLSADVGPRLARLTSGGGAYAGLDLPPGAIAAAQRATELLTKAGDNLGTPSLENARNGAIHALRGAAHYLRESGRIAAQHPTATIREVDDVLPVVSSLAEELSSPQLRRTYADAMRGDMQWVAGRLRGISDDAAAATVRRPPAAMLRELDAAATAVEVRPGTPLAAVHLQRAASHLASASTLGDLRATPPPRMSFRELFGASRADPAQAAERAAARAAQRDWALDRTTRSHAPPALPY